MDSSCIWPQWLWWLFYAVYYGMLSYRFGTLSQVLLQYICSVLLLPVWAVTINIFCEMLCFIYSRQDSRCSWGQTSGCLPASPQRLEVNMVPGVVEQNGALLQLQPSVWASVTINVVITNISFLHQLPYPPLINVMYSTIIMNAMQ